MTINYTDDPLDAVRKAGAIANATGRTVHVNGINMHPDKPVSRASKIGYALYLIVIGGIVLFMCLGFVVAIL